MRRKILLMLFVAISFFVLSSSVNALETIQIGSQQDYFNAIATINSSNETNFVISLTDDVTLSTSPTNAQVTLSGTKNVTMLGNGHTLKISDTGSYGYRALLNIGSNVIVTLGKEDGSDKLNIEGGGPTVSTSESLFNVNGIVNLYDGVSIGNNHSGNGAMVGGAFDLNTNGTVNMYGGRIHDNSSTGACLGGAVMIDDANTTFNMYGGIIENNYVCDVGAAYGGAIAVYDSSQTAVLNIEGGTFKNNSALYGGAIANLYGILKIKNATFEGNKATSTSQNEEPSGGAIIQYSSKEGTIENTVFKNNIAGSGGAIHDYAISLVVKNSTFDGNKANLDGGAIFVDPYRGDLTSIGNTFINNEAENGGAINNGRKLSSTNDIIKNNKAKVGAGIYTSGSTNTINSDVYSNKATVAANDIFIATTASNLEIKNPSTINSTVTFDDGATNITGWYNDSRDSRFTVSNPTAAVDTITAGTEYSLTAAGSSRVAVVKFNGEGVSIDDQMIVAGEKVIKPTEPTRDGYTFAGWYTDENYTTLFDFNSSVNDNVVLYAKWNKKTNNGIINPNTGDKLLLYVSIFGLSILSIAGITLYKKKFN